MPKGFPNPKPIEPLKPTSEGQVKAFTVLRKTGGWVMVAYTIQDGKVVKEEATEPDLRMCATEAFKIAAYKWWSKQ